MQLKLKFIYKIFYNVLWSSIFFFIYIVYFLLMEYFADFPKFQTYFFFSDVQKVRPALHCGYANKPLEKYDANSYRSRMPLPDVKMPSKNASQIELGERK